MSIYIHFYSADAAVIPFVAYKSAALYLVHGPTEVPMHPPPPMILNEWYQIVQWALRNDLSDVFTI